MKTLLVLLALFVAAVPGVATAVEGDLRASQEAAFRRGNDAYFHGRYGESVDAYEQVVALGVIAEDLFYNLGNAYLKAGQLGPAIYNYERALELDPTQDDVLFNLKAAREAAKRKGSDRLEGAEGTPWWMRAVQTMTLGALSWIFLVFYVVAFALLIVLHFVQPGFVRVSLLALFAFIAIGAAGYGSLLAGRLYLGERVEQAIVLPDVVPAEEGPDPNYQAVFTVHAGLRVRITEKEQDWVRVRLSNGLEGWLRERDVGRL